MKEETLRAVREVVWAWYEGDRGSPIADRLNGWDDSSKAVVVSSETRVALGALIDMLAARLDAEPEVHSCHENCDKPECVAAREQKDAVKDATWTCEIGPADRAALPEGCDSPMRKAVRAAFLGLTGHYPDFISSGWGSSAPTAPESDEGWPSREEFENWWQFRWDLSKEADGVGAPPGAFETYDYLSQRRGGKK